LNIIFSGSSRIIYFFLKKKSIILYELCTSIRKKTSFFSLVVIIIMELAFKNRGPMVLLSTQMNFYFLQFLYIIEKTTRKISFFRSFLEKAV